MVGDRGRVTEEEGTLFVGNMGCWQILRLMRTNIVVVKSFIKFLS